MSLHNYVLLLGAVALCALPARAETYYVATDGDDASGDGSPDRPWATIDHAVDNGITAGGGHTVVVRDGVYEGSTTISRGFPELVVVQAENLYQVLLTNTTGTEDVLRVYVDGSANLRFEGFLFTNDDPSYTCSGRETSYVIHLQDVSDITLANNVIFGNTAAGRCNELLKINRSHDAAYPRQVVIRGNLFYDQVNAGGADMIDAVRAGEIEIVENVFWGEPTHTESQSFITLKRQAPAVAETSSPRFMVRRNVFMNYGGATDQAFVQFGEDGDAEIMLSDALVENNLIIGNSPAQMAAPFQFKGAQNVVVRANTIVGDLPGGSYGFRIGTEGDNPPVSGFEIYNNIWADPTGTMGTRLINTYGDVDVSSITLDRNLYFNAGNALPTDGSVTPADDAHQVVGDPLLNTDHAAIAMPRWDPDADAFPSGSPTIRDEFLLLVETYGALAEGSVAVGAADPAHMPADDIRGLLRDEQPDLGAYELSASTLAPDAGPAGYGGSAGSGSGGAGTGDGGAADSGGCSCRVGERKRSGPSCAMLLAGLLVLSRRRLR